MRETIRQPASPAVYTQYGPERPREPVVQEDKDAQRAGYMFIGICLLMGVVFALCMYMIFA